MSVMLGNRTRRGRANIIIQAPQTPAISDLIHCGNEKRLWSKADLGGGNGLITAGKKPLNRLCRGLDQVFRQLLSDVCIGGAPGQASRRPAVQRASLRNNFMRRRISLLVLMSCAV